MNNLLTFKEFLNENYIQLNESFKSLTLSQFVANFPAKSFYAKLPKGILWNEIPEEEVISGSSLDDTFKKEVKNDNYVVFWFNDAKQLLKYKSPTYTKWGAARVNSIYLPEYFMFITRGNSFLTNTADIKYAVKAEQKYDKPLSGNLGSVKKVYDELRLSAIAIKWDTLKKFSSEEILKLRKSQKEGALALQNVQNILQQNERRYREYVQKAKLEKGTKELTIKTEEKMNSITAEMDKLSSVTTYDLFNTKFSDYKEDKFGSLNFNTEHLKKLESLANQYNEISYAYSRYIEYFKKNIDSHKLSYAAWYKNSLKQEADKYTEELIKLIS